MLRSNLNERLVELIWAHLTTSPRRSSLLVKEYVQLTGGEILEKVANLSCIEFLALAKELGPFFESHAEAVVWDAFFAEAVPDAVTFESIWIKLSPHSRDRIRHIAPIFFLIWEYWMHVMRIELLAPELVALLKDPWGPGIDELNEMVCRRYGPTTAGDLQRLLGTPLEKWTYSEMSGFCLLDGREWAKMFRKLGYSEKLRVRKILKSGPAALSADYAFTRKIKELHKILCIIKPQDVPVPK